jgi:hypothetical protein
MLNCITQRPNLIKSFVRISYLRPADIDGAKHSRAILKLLAERIRQTWPSVRIIFRGDSGFCRWRLMRWCDLHEVDYIIGLARNAVLERMALSWTEMSKAQFEQTHQKQRIRYLKKQCWEGK